MRIQSTATVVASMFVVLIFAVLFNMTSTSSVNATSTLLQDVDGKFDPVQEGEQEEEEWDEEEKADLEDFEEDGEEEEFEEDFEREFVFLEMEKLQIENNKMRIEFMERLTEIASSKQGTAGYAIMHLGEFMDEAEAVEMLESIHASEELSTATKNLARMKLAEVYREMDQPDKVRQILKLLIFGE